MTKEIKYNLKEFTDGLVDRNSPRAVKMGVLSEFIDPTRYVFKGFDKNGSVIRLLPRFHNTRDNKGRFAVRRKK